jgi:hypothetical protein
MKRAFSVIIILLILFSLMACKTKNDVAPVLKPEAKATIAPTPQPDVADKGDFITAKIDTDLVRQAKILIPNQSFDVVTSIKAGTELSLIKAGTEWHKVSFDGQEGFVLATDVEGTDPAPSPYYIYIEKGSHTISVFERDENGEYTKLLNSYLTATGKTAGKTPTGVFAISKKYAWKQFDSAGTDRPYSYSPYVSQFTDGIYMHGPVFAEEDFNTMFGNTYKEIGTNSTAGCLRTNVGSASWIYMNCPMGTVVEVVNGSPREIQTPELIKAVHDLEKGRYYDPTDPNYEEEE